MRLGLLCAAAVLVATPGRAEIASPWDQSLSSRARLVAGQVPVPSAREEKTASEDGAVYLGVEVLIDPGTKTYWRNPGDSGIPPSFDWSQSDNLKSVEVLYPAPHRIADPAGHTIGYKNAVLFPVRVAPQDAAQPVDVKLKFSYAVCGTLCVPAEANLALRLPAGGEVAGASTRIETGLAQVPRRAGASGTVLNHDDVPVVRAVEVKEDGGRKDLRITVAQAAGSKKSDLFLEGPRDWYLPLPERVARRPQGAIEEIEYRVALDALPAAASLSGTLLKLTVVGEGGALEQDWTLR